MRPSVNLHIHFFARLYQKSLEMLDQIEYDLVSLDSASNFHFSAQSQRMNQIMKTLTIFSVIGNSLPEISLLNFSISEPFFIPEINDHAYSDKEH